MDKNYLFIEDINLLKKKVEANPELYRRLVNQCKRYEGIILTERHPKGSSSFMGMAAANLSLLSLLSGEKRWVDEAKRWIFTAVSYKNWGHTHLIYPDINSSWVLFGLSLSYSWISNYLTKSEKKAFKERLLLQGNRKFDYLSKHQTDGWPVRYWQNHNWLNFTGLATVAYALEEEFSAKANKWKDRARENFKNVFANLPDDGSFYEGVTYWRYGVIWLLQYAHLIKTHEGIDLFNKSPFLRNTFYYRFYQTAPVYEQNYNFGDCHDTRSGHSSAIYFKLASEFRIPEAQWMGDNVNKNLLYKEAYESSIEPGILPEAFLELLWYNPYIPKKIPKKLKFNKFFPDLGLLSCRSGWSPEAFSFSVKAGYPGGRKQWLKSWELEKKEGFSRRSLCHQHADDGSFIIWRGENNYIIDDGYNRDVKACDHNMILFDGKGYPGEGRHNIFKHSKEEQFAEVECCIQQDNLVYMIVNTKNVYDKDLGVSCLRRHFFYGGEQGLLIYDEVEVKNCRTISWQIHSEDHFISDNNRYRTIDRDFILTPLVDRKIVAERESKVITSVLNLQEPDRKTRRKMEKLSFKIDNPGERVYFMHHIQTGNKNNAFHLECIEDDNSFKVIKTDGMRVERITLSKKEDNKFDYTLSINNSITTEFNNLEEV